MGSHVGSSVLPTYRCPGGPFSTVFLRPIVRYSGVCDVICSILPVWRKERRDGRGKRAIEAFDPPSLSNKRPRGAAVSALWRSRGPGVDQVATLFARPQWTWILRLDSPLISSSRAEESYSCSLTSKSGRAEDNTGGRRAEGRHREQAGHTPTHGPRAGSATRSGQSLPSLLSSSRGTLPSPPLPLRVTLCARSWYWL